jgi:hypothetical protein
MTMTTTCYVKTTENVTETVTATQTETETVTQTFFWRLTSEV